MSDETKQSRFERTHPGYECLDVTSPEKATTITAPTVHSDTLWGGPRFIHNAGLEPVWVETKQQYWDLLNRMGFVMKDQAESTTGPERPATPWIEKAEAVPEAPAAVLSPFLPSEAEVIYAEDALLVRYGLREALYCETCAENGLPHGCRVEIDRHRISVFCRCGTRSFQAFGGTTDLPTTLGGLSPTLNDVQSGGTATTQDGTTIPVKVVWLHSDETKILRAYVALMRKYDYAPFWQCKTCHPGKPIGPDTTLGVSITPDRVALMCGCRMFVSSK